MQTDVEYRNSKNVSQSLIKSLLYGVGLYHKLAKEEEEETHFLIGDAVDILLTQGEDVFKELFYVSKVEKPSDTIMNIVNYVYTRDSSKFNNTQTLVSEACKVYNYQPNWKDDTRLFKILELGGVYWSELERCKGRTMIDSEQNQIITKVVESLRNHQFTKHIFEMESLNQLAIYFELDGIPCKALLDRVNIDHVNKTLQPIDIKTIGDYTKSFKFNAQRFRYDIQAAWYTEALEHWKRFNYPDYEILPFQFVVESTKYPGFCPLIFNCNQSDLNSGKYGINVITQVELFNPYGKQIVERPRAYKGFLEGLELYKWYEQNSYELDKEIVESNGELTLEVWS